MLIEIIALIIIVVSVIIGYKKGFVSSILNFGGVIIAYIGATLLDKPIATFIFNVFFRNSLIKSVNEKIIEAVGSKTDAVNSFVDKFPKLIRPFFEDKFGSLTTSLNENIGSGAEKIVDDFIGPAYVAVITMIVFFTLIIVLTFLVRLLAKLFVNINKVPLVGTLNSVLGLFTGLLQGVVSVIILTILINFVLAVLTPNNGIHNALKDSFLGKTLLTLPATGFFIKSL